VCEYDNLTKADNFIVQENLYVLLSAGADPGAGRGPNPPPYFRKSQFYFFTLYTMSEKIFLNLNLVFIVEKSEKFLEVLGGVCVCV